MPRLRTLAPWLLALLALAWAGASHVPWDRLAALAPFLALVLVILLALAILIHLTRRRRRAPDPASMLAARRRRALRRTIAAARRQRPQNIWLCLGLPRHGKTALLAAAGPHRDITSDSSPDPSAPLVRLLESTRDITLEHPAEPQLLRRLRPRQPIDAIVLAVAIPDLLDTDPTALATALRAQLIDALTGLDVDPPIYLACTKLDRLAGHHELAADPSRWGFELPALADLPQHLARWSRWVHGQRLARIASEPDPDRRARLFTLGAQFDRLCERLLLLIHPLLAPHHGAPLRLRGVHFTAARPDAARPADALLSSLAASLHIDLRPAQSPTHDPRPTDLAPFFAMLRRRAPEAARSPAHHRRARRRTHLLAGILALAALALSISAVAAADLHRAHLQRLADLAATLDATEPVPPLLALRAELDPPDPSRPYLGLTRLLTPDLAPTLLAAYRHAARERLLRPLWSTLARDLQRTPDYDLLRAYLLLTAPAPSDMSDAPGPEDPVQSDWLLATLPRLADADTADHRLLLAALFAHATPDDLRFPRDHALVERVRARLHAQGDDEAILRAALTAADARCEPLTLAAISHADHLAPGPAIACSFTRDGWPHVQEQLLRATERRSDWILGRPVLAHADADRLTRLRDRHDALYVAAWTDFLAGIRVRRPVDLTGAASLLTELTGEDPPLARLFKILDHHTRGLQHLRPDERSLFTMLGGIDDPRRSAALARAFAPLLQFAVAAPDRQSGLDRYHARLTDLLGALEAARRDPAALPDLQTRLDAALADTHALLQPPDLRRFRPLLSALLLPPLTALQSILRDHDRLALTAAYCSEVHAPLRRMAARYPFARDAHDELTLAELTAFFHPRTGALRRFRDDRLAPLLIIHGDDITARPTARGDDHPLAPEILALLHRAAVLGDLAFTGDDLGLDLDLDLHCNADIGRVTFTLDGAAHTYACGPDHRARMRWPGQGEPRGAVLELLGRDGRRETVPGRGPWGLWRLLEKDGVTLPPDDPAAARLVFRLDLRPGRLGVLDLAVTPTKTRGATLFYGDPTRTPGPPLLLAPLRAHELLNPPPALFTGLSTCDELPAAPD